MARGCTGTCSGIQTFTSWTTEGKLSSSPRSKAAAVPGTRSRSCDEAPEVDEEAEALEWDAAGAIRTSSGKPQATRKKPRRRRPAKSLAKRDKAPGMSLRRSAAFSSSPRKCPPASSGDSAGRSAAKPRAAKFASGEGCGLSSARSRTTTLASGSSWRPAAARSMSSTFSRYRSEAACRAPAAATAASAAASAAAAPGNLASTAAPAAGREQHTSAAEACSSSHRPGGAMRMARRRLEGAGGH
mmetsp:Transcript_6848/g.25606  ORF Transcript_6848/g.25606 Transcript_6848/m.25606 type:complete len:243 (-) Transcript_6848:59-787(-)